MAALVIYFLQEGCGKPVMASEQPDQRVFPYAIVPCRAAACKRAMLPCGNAVNPRPLCAAIHLMPERELAQEQRKLSAPNKGQVRVT
jgi:hypothetical protein